MAITIQNELTRESFLLDAVAAVMADAAGLRDSDGDDGVTAVRIQSAMFLRAVRLELERIRNRRTVFSRARTLATVKV